MAEYTRIVEPMECDYYRHMPPSIILAHSLSMMQADFVSCGIGRAVIQSEHGAVWMISSMVIRQFSNLCVGDTINYRTYPRIIDGKKYVFRLDIFRGCEKIVEFETNFIAVREKERKIVPVEELERHWSEKADIAERAYMPRLRPGCVFADAGGDTVRMSDCDSNGHMTSAGYLSMACDALGFWGGEEEKLMRMMQVDFISEVRPGTYVKFETGEENGIKYMRGVKSDGKIAFVAACEF